MKQAFILFASAAVLAACSPTGGSKAPIASVAWDATDACGLVSNADVAAAAGTAVTSAKLDLLNKGGDGLAAVSTCTYALADGSTITLLARKAASADATPQTIEAARTMGGVAPPADVVAGLGKAAFWTSGMKTLQVFIDDQRYITLSAFQGTGDAQSTLTSVARKAF